VCQPETILPKRIPLPNPFFMQPECQTQALNPLMVKLKRSSEVEASKRGDLLV
jgi:hypothetical protein